MWTERAQSRDRDAGLTFWEDIRLGSPWAKGEQPLRPHHSLFLHINRNLQTSRCKFSFGPFSLN